MISFSDWGWVARFLWYHSWLFDISSCCHVSVAFRCCRRNKNLVEFTVTYQEKYGSVGWDFILYFFPTQIHVFGCHYASPTYILLIASTFLYLYANHQFLFFKYFYAPNFKEVQEAYWFGPVRLCVSRSHFAYGQEQLEVGSWNLNCGISMKNKRTCTFFSFRSDFSLQNYAPFSTFFLTLPL